MLRDRDHVLLRAPSYSQSGTLLDEFSAAARWGIVPDVTGSQQDGWFDLPRETRAAMVAFDQIQRFASAASQLDNQDYWDAYAEQRSKRRKGSRS